MSTSLSEKLILAAKKGHVREVRRLLGRGALFTKDQYGNTALHEAAWNGNKDVVKALLGAYCFVDSINNSGFTPLHLASQNGHAKVAKTLLKWKADPSLLNQYGETALHLVAKYNHAGVVSAFASFKIPMDIRGKDGNTALHISAKLGNIEVMKSLLHHGADPTTTNMKGIRALDCAEAGNYKECVKLIQSAILKWKPKPRRTAVRTSSNEPRRTAVGSTSNDYTNSGTSPKARQRADTYSSNSTPSDSPASKSHKVKTKSGTSFKQYITSRERKLRKGYFSQDECYQPPGTDFPYFSASQEVPSSFSYGSRGGEGGMLGQSQSTSPVHNKSASIDQLLNEIEREYNSPSYRYAPPQDQQKEFITPYAEIRQLDPPHSRLTGPSHLSRDRAPVPLNGKPLPGFSLSQDGNFPDNYDFLPPSSSSFSSSQDYDNHKLKSYQNPTHNSSHSAQNLSHISYSTPRPSNLQSSVNKNHSHIHNSGHRHHIHRGRDKPLSLKLNKSPSRSPRKSPSKSPCRSTSHSPRRERGMPEDMDTYVYMAPLSDFERRGGKESEIESCSEVSIQLKDVSSCSEASSINGSECGSRNSKKAVICNSPMHADRKHEPNSSLEPIKGILSQSSATENDKSQLEMYLQDELETMRQAFQIRLGQMEKRYQRQLVEQKKHLALNAPASTVLVKKSSSISPHQTNSSKRRNSWHSYIPSEQELDKLAQPDEPRSGSSMGIDSDHSVEGSDTEFQTEEWTESDTTRRNTFNGGYSSVDSGFNELPESMRGQQSGQEQPIYSTPTKTKEGLKGGARSWNEGTKEGIEFPHLSPVNGELSKDEVGAIDEESKKLIQHKIDEYRKKMMRYFQEKSEAQISIIEEKYQKQMDEVKRKYDEKATEKLSHLTTRIKGLENMLDVQTLV